MKTATIFFVLLALVGCGPSREERQCKQLAAFADSRTYLYLPSGFTGPYDQCFLEYCDGYTCGIREYLLP